MACELRGRERVVNELRGRERVINELRGHEHSQRAQRSFACVRGCLRDLPGDSDLYIFCDVLKYLVCMQADVRSSIIIMIQLRYVRIS